MTGGLVKYTFRAIGRLVWLAVAVLATIIGAVSCRETVPEPTTAPEIMAVEVSDVSFDSAVLTATVTCLNMSMISFETAVADISTAWP